MALRITIIYLIVGCLWIFFSDLLMDWFIDKEQLNASQSITISIIKGTGYVLLTGLGLYFFSNKSFNKLQGLEKQYRRLFEDNPNPMWVYDSSTLQFLAVNIAAQKTYGYSEKEFLTLNLKDIRPQDDIKILENRLENVDRTYSNSGVYRHLKKNGVIFYVNIYSNPTVFKNINARIVLALDVSEKQVADNKIIELNQSLQAYKNKLNSILSNVNDVVWICSPDDYRVTYISSACHKVYGFAEDEFYANSMLWQQLIHQDDAWKMKDAFEKLFEKGSNEQEYRIISKDGTVKVMYDKSFVTYDDAGKPKEIQGVATDITRLRESEQKLIAYSQRIATILDGITDGFITLDNEYNLTYVNNVFESITNSDREILLNKKIWEVFEGFKNTPFYTHLLYARQNDISYSFETNYIVPGSWYSCKIYPNPGGLSIFFADVTEVYKMNEEVRKSKNNLYSLINTTTDLIWSIDTNLNLLTFNQAFKNYVETIVGEIIEEGQSALSQKLPADVSIAWQDTYVKGLKGELQNLEFIYPIEGVEENPWLEIRFNPIFSSNGEIIGLSCFGRDITERKKYEHHIEQQNQRLMEIAWMQSHEVRGPLSSIIAIGNLYNRQNLADPTNLELLTLLDRATDKLDGVIHKIVTNSNEAISINSIGHQQGV